LENEKILDYEIGQEIEKGKLSEDFANNLK
jgi:hypothetical protein